ncbi:MAG: ROK family protein [Candidatus Omnitrophica bacterium]|nr:ROK family protein [Candidatus Omnitrophota bacterium]
MHKTKNTAVGIDIGGTKISMVIGTAGGKILAKREIPTQKGRYVKACIDSMIHQVQELMADFPDVWERLKGIGVGIPGPVDSKQGIVPKSPHMTGWEGLELGKILHHEFNLPVRMTNDANAAALGEKMFGEGKREKHFVYLTVSTGIGGGLVANGELIEGASFMGGEVGHMKIIAAGRLCKCGKAGCLEAYASGTAIADFAREAIRKGRRTQILHYMPKNAIITAKEVGLAAKKRDPLALEIFRQAGFYLGVGISNLLHLVNPSMVVLGGGVFKSAPPDFWKFMMRSVRAASWPAAYHAVKIKRSKLGESVGDFGALAVAFQKFGPEKK